MSSAPALPVPRAWVLSGVLVAFASAWGLVLFVPGGDTITRAGLHTWDAGHMLALGIVAAAWTAGLARLDPARRGVVRCVSVLPILAIVVVVVPEDLRGPAGRIAARHGIPGAAWLGALGLAAAVILVAWLGRITRVAALRHLGVVLAMLAVAANHTMIPQRHPGLHLVVVIAALVGIACALRPDEPGRLGAHDAFVHALAMLSIAVPAPPRVAALMADARGCVLFPWLPRAAPVPPPMTDDDPWFRSRDGLAPIAPTQGLDRPDAPIVLLVSVDSLGAATLVDRRAADAIPTLRSLAHRSVWFTAARSTSTRTIAALATMFAARHHSALQWRTQEHPLLGETWWPAPGGAARLAGHLAAAGIHTITVAATDYLVHDYGVVTEFADERVVASTPGIGPGHEPPWADATAVVDALIERLHALDADTPAFLFAHLLDAHAPYDRGDVDSRAHVRDAWLAELTLVDAELARLFAAIDAAGLRERTTIVLTADHGEAFGAHGTWTHGTSLYDDTLRIPLLVHAPGFAAARVDTPVSLVDVAPTIADLFALPIPAPWMGESLVPALLGRPWRPTRPIAFEARPEQGLLRDDGVKVIHDLRFRTVEVYDVLRDPDERHNLFDGDAGWLTETTAFFAAHEHTAPGYETPVR